MDRNRVLDELLVIKSKEGDRKAFALLVKRWHKKIIQYAFKITGQQEVAKDIAQDSWHAILNKLNTLKDPSKFKYWIFKIAHNKAMDWGRRNQKDWKLAEEFSKEAQLDSVSTDENEKVDKVRRLMEDLPANQRLVLNLFYMEGFDLKQIAEILDLQVGTIKSRIFYAREHLKKI